MRRQWVQVVLVLTVFALFVVNASGAFELIIDIPTGSVTAPTIVHTREFVVLVFIGILLSLLLPLLSPIKASLLTFVAMLPILFMGYTNTGQRALLPMEYSLLTVLMLFVVNVLISYFTETTRKQQLINAFGQYVPAELAKRISQDPEQFSLEGESRELSIMFCDVHNFSAISEQLEPKELAELLNTLFTPLTRILYKHHGIIDKYMGDAIMAFWGAPLEDAEHARHALQAAMAMLAELRAIQERFQAKGWPAIKIGIGLNTGSMSVGNMGSEFRKAYTVMGDAVNLGSRLEGLTKTYGVQIIVNETTAAAVPEYAYRELDRVRVKGKDKPVTIYEPLGLREEVDKALRGELKLYREALKLYRGENWDMAELQFLNLANAHPDRALYREYVERIAIFRNSPPPPGWDGVFTHQTK